jgi:FtsH-binding integral membrane protein
MLKSSKEKKSWGFNIGLLCVQIVLIVGMCMPIPIFIKFLLFCIFSILNGINLASLNLNETIVKLSFYGTMSIFGIMTLIGMIFTVLNINLGPKIGLSLFYGLLLLILVGLFNIITGNTKNKLYSIAGLILFSIYIIYDTNYILQRNYKGDFILASLDYYLDILNIFLLNR